MVKKLKKSTENSSGLRVENLVKTYSKVKVVNKVSFELKEGEIVGLLGPNGSGKTTSFYMTLGLVPADSGSVYLRDQNITGLSMHHRARLGLAYLPQEASIFRKLTVAQNIEAVLELHHKNRHEIYKIRDELLAALHLEKVASQQGFTLSGGERRRCEIARLLATKPSFVLLDEPFAGVDPIAVLDIQALITWLSKKGLGVFITDHNVRETLKITDRSYVIYAGKILAFGTPDELLANAEVRQKYLGKDFYI